MEDFNWWWLPLWAPLSCCDSLWLRTTLFIHMYSNTLSPYLSALDFCNFPVLNIKFDELDFVPSMIWIFLPAVACKIQVWNTYTKDQVHQNRYFKLENCKNQVQIDRGCGYISFAGYLWMQIRSISIFWKCCLLMILCWFRQKINAHNVPKNMKNHKSHIFWFFSAITGSWLLETGRRM